MSLCQHSWSFVRQYLASDFQIDQWPYNDHNATLVATSLSEKLTTKDYNDTYDISTSPILKWESPAMAEVFGHWCQYDTPSRLGHAVVGVLLLAVGLTGIVGNATVIIVFIWYRRLRTPSNTLIVNLAISDLLMSALHPMASYSSFIGYWQFGRLTCDLYAAFCGLFGLVSIVSLSFLALERCLVISIKPWYGELHVTPGRVKGVAFFTWFYCLLCVAPPFFGWGNYVPEGLLTSCSFDYITRDVPTRLFVYFLFTLGFFLPLIVIVACYSAILVTICRHENDMIKANIKNDNSTFKASNQRTTVGGGGSQFQGRFRYWRKRSDFKSAEMILIIIGVFLLSWTPYAIVAILGQFGDLELLTPWVSYVPCIFAKMSTMYNPFIYGLSHQRFRSSLRHMLGRGPRANSMTLPLPGVPSRGAAGGGGTGTGHKYVSRQFSESQQSVKSNRTFRSVVVKYNATGPTVPLSRINCSVEAEPSGSSSKSQEVKGREMVSYKACYFCKEPGVANDKVAQAEHFL